MSDAVLHSRRIEFVCNVCLHSAYALDTAKPPHCPHAHGAMTPDSNEIRRWTERLRRREEIIAGRNV